MALVLSSGLLLACDSATNPPTDPDAPPPKPLTITLDDLTVITPQVYPVEDGRTIKVTLTNFCDQRSEIGFSPDDGKPPIVWELQPMQRQEITIPKGYALWGRYAGEDEWTDARCVAGNNQHLTLNVHCASCTVGARDPLDREGCVAAGACLPDDPEDEAEVEAEDADAEPLDEATPDE